MTYPAGGYSPDIATFEKDVLARATLFTAFVQARGQRIKAERATQDEAIEAAKTLAAEHGKAVLVYGVSPEGRQALAGTVHRDGKFETTNHR